MAKPVGRSGPFETKANIDGTVHGSYQRIEFPSSKNEIEMLIADWFVGSLTKAAVSTGEAPMFSDLKPNPENDFDFTVSTERGPAYLELQEVAPLNGPYEKAQAPYKPYYYAQYILMKILEKSNKYPKSGVRHIFLLVYTTHWSFMLSDATIACLRHWLHQKPTVFRAVFTFTPLAWMEGIPQWLCPVPPELREGFDPETVRDNVCLNLDSEKFHVIQQRER